MQSYLTLNTVKPQCLSSSKKLQACKKQENMTSRKNLSIENNPEITLPEKRL